MTEQNALFVLDPGPRPVGDMERETIKQLEELAEVVDFTSQQKLIAQTARALAQNIDRGNVKGRSIGNEAAQLLQAIEMLTPEEVDDDAATATIPAATKELFDALQSPALLAALPRVDRTEVRDTA